MVTKEEFLKVAANYVPSPLWVQLQDAWAGNNAEGRRNKKWFVIIISTLFLTLFAGGLWNDFIAHNTVDLFDIGLFYYVGWGLGVIAGVPILLTMWFATWGIVHLNQMAKTLGIPSEKVQDLLIEYGVRIG